MKARYFLSTPERKIKFFGNKDEALEALKQELEKEREYAWDDGWREDLEEDLFVGEIIYRLEKTNYTPKPDKSQLDENEYDEDGDCWRDIEAKFDYEITP